MVIREGEQDSTGSGWKAAGPESRQTALLLVRSVLM